MTLLFLISLSLTFSCLNIYLLTIVSLGSKKRIKNRITKYLPKKEHLFYETPLLVRILQPLIKLLSKLIDRFTPINYKKYLQQLLVRIDQRFSIQDILILKFLLLVIAAIFCVFSFWFTSFNVLFIVFTILIYFSPDMFIRNLIKKRRKEIEEELPALMDMLSVILEAGISFDNGVQKLCERKDGPIYNELKYYMNQLRMGTSREKALEVLAERIQLNDFHALVRSIIQGEKMGISILKTIQSQAEQIRIKRKQRIEEKAAKIPIKILFPIIFFIFPPIFMIILGPGIIKIVESFY